MGRCKKERHCRRLKDEMIYKPIGLPTRMLLMNEIEQLTEIKNCLDIIQPSFPVISIAKDSRIFVTLFVLLEYLKTAGICSEKTFRLQWQFMHLNFRVFIRMIVLF